MIDERLWQEIQRLYAGQLPPPQVVTARFAVVIGEVDGNRVLLVDGDRLKIRPDKKSDTKPHMDFVEGDNDLECSWVRREFGKRVLLIDDKVMRTDWPFITYHEGFERRTMSQGASYGAAHTKANAGERLLRIRTRGRG